MTDQRRTDQPKGQMKVKVYLVCQRLYAVRDERPNVRVLAARLTRGDAAKIVAEIPGTFIRKVIATKSR